MPSNNHLSQRSQGIYYEGGRRNNFEQRSQDTDGSLYEPDQSQAGGDEYRTPKKRIYYADWTRALAIQLVIFVHCLVNSADASGFDPDADPGTQQKKDGIIKCLVQIGIPMFFYISGMGATFFNTEGKGFGIFVYGKTTRLLIPFVLAIFIFLIPRLYFGQQYEDFCRPNGKVENDYWAFQMATLPTIFSKLSWLWYLPALFIDCILTYPLLAWTMRRANKIPFSARDDGNIIFLQLIILAIWCYPCFYMDTSMNYGTKYLLPSVGTLACILFCFYTFQLLIYNTENGDKWALAMKFIGPIGSCCLNLWKTQAPDMPLHHVLMMINYDAVFFSQGLVDQAYWRPMLRTRNEAGKTAWAPICVVLGILLYALSSPQNYSQTGFLFFYPLYSDYTIQCLYTTGTWMWVFFITWVMQSIANKKFNDTAYNLLAGGSLYAYLSHYFFIIMIAVLVIRPYKITFVPALILEILLTNMCILISYLILNFFYELAFPPKQPQMLKDMDAAGQGEEERRALMKNQEVMVEGNNQRT